MVAFSGDEVSGVIIDFGSHTIRAGYSGEDAPKCLVPATLGYVSTCPESAPKKHSIGTYTGAILSGSGKGYYVGDVSTCTPRFGLELKQYNIREESDIEPVEAVLQSILYYGLKVDPRESPIVFSEPCQMPKATREAILEYLFKTFQIPGVYIAKEPVLAAFSQGKHTCLVVDVGASGMTVAPVVDGYYLKNAIARQPLGGHLLTLQAFHMLEKEMAIPIRTYHEIKSKNAVGLKEPASFEPKNVPEGTTESFMHQARLKVAEDFKESVCQVSDIPFHPVDLGLRPARFYEFPDGCHHPFLAERYRIPEILFNPKEFLSPAGTDMTTLAISQLLGVHELIQKSLSGSTLFPGFIERLTSELLQTMPTHKVKVFSSGPQERKAAPWIGGSILSSLSSFQQLWITKAEYEEHGPAYVEKRCHL